MNSKETPRRYRQNRFYCCYGKRILDLILTIPALIMLAPVMVAIALLIRDKIGRPIFFRQQRPGLHGKPFTLYKFRTMTEARDARGDSLPDSERLMPLGRCLRKYSLDELPELFNVLKGDMSFVGPRPLLMEYLPYYSAEQQRRHDRLPGITGWAQIHGRNECLFSRRLQFDIWYTEHLSFLLDVKILVSSVLIVLQGRGVRSDMEQYLSEVDDLGLSRRHQSSEPSKEMRA
jgi:sugar transferase EpsL